MHAILSRIPTKDALHRRLPAIAGFTFGVAVTLCAGALFSVIYTGQGLSHVPVEIPPVYPNF
ncbi:MAG: hypothetical protein QNJ44_13200 [Rhodobacter sp.]|nr:hypothetical protein [Rhodobacter sp.]